MSKNQVLKAKKRVDKLQAGSDNLAADLVKQNAKVAAAGAADRFEAERDAAGLSEALADNERLLQDAQGDLKAAKVAYCVEVVNQAREDYQAANNGPDKVLAGVDKRIEVLAAIHEAARDTFSDTREIFNPGDRQAVEVRIQSMHRHLGDLRAARAALAELL